MLTLEGRSLWAKSGKKSFCVSFVNRETAMLVLSRKLGEKIVIGENIRITVVKIDRNQIRIGIEAPPEVSVFREEIAPGRAGRESRADAVVMSN
jgi:carbon storage regulator